MSNSRIRQNLMKTGRRKLIWDSRRRGLNPHDLRTMGKFPRWTFVLKVHINIISHLKVVINPLEHPQARLITQRYNPWNVGVVENKICWVTSHIGNKKIGESTTSKRIPQSMMWLGASHISMYPWIIDKLTTKLQWWIWKVLSHRFSWVNILSRVNTNL